VIEDVEGRWELKYVLPTALHASVLERVAGVAEADPHADDLGDGRRGYYVHSLYFDTPRLDDYFDRLAARRIRNRLRVRTYGWRKDARPVFLENKRKLEERVCKQRRRVTDAETWCTSGPTPWRDTVSDWAGRHFAMLVDGEGRHPVVTVHYRRDTWVSSRPKARLTLDSSITACAATSASDLFAPGTHDVVPGDLMVMELKFDGDCPGWMRALVRDLRLRAEPVSKFGLSVARVHRGDRPRELRALAARALVRRWFT
jgi:hypothetical protein